MGPPRSITAASARLLRALLPESPGAPPAATRALDAVQVHVAAAGQTLGRERAPRTVQAHRTALFGWSISLAVAAFGVVTYLVRQRDPLSWDLALTLRLQRVRLPCFGALMRAVSLPGFPPWSQALVVSVATLLWALRYRLEALFCLSTWVAGLLSFALKRTVGRPRPDTQLVQVWFRLHDHSYPSGHTMSYVTFYGFLFYLAYANLRPSRKRTLAMLLTGSLVALVGPSRVYNGQHWASDVLAAYSLGLGHLLATIYAYRRAKARRERHPLTG